MCGIIFKIYYHLVEEFLSKEYYVLKFEVLNRLVGDFVRYEKLINGFIVERKWDFYCDIV